MPKARPRRLRFLIITGLPLALVASWLGARPPAAGRPAETIGGS